MTSIRKRKKEFRRQAKTALMRCLLNPPSYGDGFGEEVVAPKPYTKHEAKKIAETFARIIYKLPKHNKDKESNE